MSTEIFIPQWISVLFLIAIPIPVVLIGLAARKGAPQHRKNVSLYTVLVFYFSYFTYVTICSFNGLLDKIFFPPVILLYTTFPLMIFLFTVVIRSTFYKTIVENIVLEDLLKVHIFRLIGVFFLFLAYHETLPKFFAIVAGLGDMITAITSVFVANAVKANKPYAKKLVYFWNSFGLIDILFTAISSLVLTKISIDTGAMGVETLAKFPFCYIPAFAPPTIVFLHIAIYAKLKKNYS
ncbi:MAG: hypothetical protein IM594_13040 [Cytophagales bacterium]|nr:hypothetical protein [Cytophagales bacterium]